MLRRATAALVFAALLSGRPLLAQSATQAGKPVLPDTPIGKLIRDWLDAFASGDTNQILGYYRKYDPTRIEDGSVNFRLGSGGFELLSVERAEPRHIELVVKERNTSMVSYAIVDLVPSDPVRVARSSLSAMGPNASLAVLSVDDAARKRVIEGAIAQLDSFYVFPEVATRVADSLRAWNRKGRYASYAKSMDFARAINEDIRAVSHDKHMRFDFSARPIPPRPAAPPPRTPEDLARDQAQMDAMNCMFQKADILEGNIGYLKFDAFPDVALCGATATAAMNFLAASRALIIDMRENGGGSPAMVQYVASYLFSKRTHLNDIWDRATGKTQEFWSRDDVPGRKFGGEKPVYVLTSSRTFSGGEEFTYDLQTQKRATIIGETTGGGAHPVGGRRVDEHFIIGVPGARAINPITHTNWEGVGVTPDVKVNAADALDTAIRMLRGTKP